MLKKYLSCSNQNLDSDMRKIIYLEFQLKMIRYLEVISQGCTEITKEGYKMQENNSQIIYSSMKLISAVK